jgi:hypothetical protein
MRVISGRRSPLGTVAQYNLNGAGKGVGLHGRSEFFSLASRYGGIETMIARKACWVVLGLAAAWNSTAEAQQAWSFRLGNDPYKYVDDAP